MRMRYSKGVRERNFLICDYVIQIVMDIFSFAFNFQKRLVVFYQWIHKSVFH